MSPTAEPVGLGIVGAGGFAGFVAAAVADLPSVRLAAVSDADTDRAARLAATHGVPATGWPHLLADPRVQAVVVATPPATHAALVVAALRAGKHVFCEKPMATSLADASTVRDTARATGLVLVVDHVLRYNPLLRLIGALRAERTLGPVQRFLFENDAADEDLPAGHWFWDPAVSGGILVEHGVHFFDAAAALVGGPAQRIQAMGAVRPHGDAAGVTDLVVATAAHSDGALATFAHGFSHPHRCERQLMRLDFGTAEARLYGWIPVTAELDMWTDDAGVAAARRLPERAADLLAVPGYRLTGAERVEVAVSANAAPAAARGRGRTRTVPHHVSVRVDLGGAAAKQRVYAESVRAAMSDLAGCVTGGGVPVAGVDSGWAAVATALAGEEAIRTGATAEIGLISVS
jgi:predicted dehydrogenase